MKVSGRVTQVRMFISGGRGRVTTETPLAVNGAECWEGSGQGVCSPDFITCVNIDFRCGGCCCYRRQVKCSCASWLRTGRCLEPGCIDGAGCLIATLH